MAARRKRILVVEDDPQVRSLLNSILTEAGYQVVLATDGTAAFHELRKRGGDFGLLLTDVDMGRMDGKELAGSVRADHPGLPILFVSGLPLPAAELEKIAPGTSLITKPFSASTLLDAVQQALSGPLPTRSEPPVSEP